MFSCSIFMFICLGLMAQVVGGLASSEPGFRSRQCPCESSVVAGRASGQHFPHDPVKALPWYLLTFVGMSELLNKVNWRR